MAVEKGCDLFDCVAATRIGRHGSIYTMRGIVHLRGEKYQSDYGPLDSECVIPGTEGFSRAYISHLIRSGEMLGSAIASIHNLGFILKLVDGAREALKAGTFKEYKESFTRDYYN